ncbi:YdcF family protein [Sphingomonas sp.]|uniref:YdcF family protein n=1 Tax=Sphingomonas sp. TaxID=28214 RepID=UPI001D461A79|nr:YdcF family protein [Sphingomonas sp.]MBX9795543.1 YdcF family protein [Sphingomonas sp.]
MIRRLVAALALAWVLGFGWFMLALPGPRAPARTDAIVVMTGAPGRIDRGLALLRAGQAKRLLVSGVGSDVTRAALVERYPHARALFACCIDLGHQAIDTRSNAEETADWVRAHGYRSVRLVTSDWHLRRAEMELESTLGPQVMLLGDGVPGDPGAPLLFEEYNKLLVRRIALWLGLGA